MSALSGELKEWITFTMQRAKVLDADADSAGKDVDSPSYERLRAKAGTFRSLALEVEVLLRRAEGRDKPEFPVEQADSHGLSYEAFKERHGIHTFELHNPSRETKRQPLRGGES